MAETDSLALLRRDHTSLASSVTALTVEIAAMKTAQAVENERDVHLKERLGRIEDSIKNLYGLGRWALLAFMGSLIAAITTFIVKGGLTVVGGA